MLKKYHRRLEEMMSEGDRQRMLQFPTAGGRVGELDCRNGVRQSEVWEEQRFKIRSHDKNTQTQGGGMSHSQKHSGTSAEIPFLSHCWCRVLDREQSETQRTGITKPSRAYDIMH